MNDNKDPFDALIQSHLRGELDGQLGRAEARFAREMARQENPGRRQMGRLFIGAVWASGVAASMGIVWGFVAHRMEPKGGLLTQHPAVVSTAPAYASPKSGISLDETISFQTIDEGTVVVKDHGPARQLRRQVLQSMNWYDPVRRERIEITVPTEQVVLVGMPSF